MSDSILRSRYYASHILTTQPRTLNKSQTLATNKAENRCYDISNAADRDYSKSEIDELLFVKFSEKSFVLTQ